MNADVDWMSEDQRALYLCSIANGLGHIVDQFRRQDRQGAARLCRSRPANMTSPPTSRRSPRARGCSARSRGCSRPTIILVSPTVTRTALSADFNGATSIVESRRRARRADAARASPDSSTRSTSPATPRSPYPSGFAADGLPTSVQIIGPRHADSGVLRLGALLEQARPWAGQKAGDRRRGIKRLDPSLRAKPF